MIATVGRAEVGRTGRFVPAKASGPRDTFAPSSPAPRLIPRLLSLVGLGDGLGALRAELDKINAFEAMAGALTSPTDFAAKTNELKRRLALGESLERLRPEAYAVARQACHLALKMRPYDVQMLGALAMDRGRIAQMKTGEGKTMTAVMAVYLNALAGKGVHVVTANENLAQRDAAEMGPAYQLLGLKVATCLECMGAEQKREAYSADVTYLTNSTLGFDYLRDRTCRDPQQRVQRAPFFALVDEVDEVLIDEARVPLIISTQSQAAAGEYQMFARLVGELVPLSDFQVDQEKRTVCLTETGEDWVANELAKARCRQQLERAQQSGNRRAPVVAAQAQQRLRVAEQISAAIRREQAGLAGARAEKQALLAKFPGLNLRHPAHSHRLPYLQTALEARGLFRSGHDYTCSYSQKLEQQLVEVCGRLHIAPTDANQTRILLAAQSQPLAQLSQDDLDSIVARQASQRGVAPAQLLGQVFRSRAELQLVDEFKGRIAEGRRFSAGLHQALEAREGLSIQPEQRSLASITYPNLFKLYPRLAGMSGTAKVAEREFRELYNLDVVEIPTNKPTQLLEEPDLVFPTAQEKYRALVDEARRCYEEGIPVLLGTRSVEVNRRLSKMLGEAGIPHQSLNADNIKHNTARENDMLARAGQSGWVTVATNMSGRGVDIKADQINYKKLALTASANPQVVVEVENPQQAERLRQWIPSVDCRVGPAVGGCAIKASDFPTGGLRVLGSERHSSRRIDEQLVGRTARQGRPGSARFYLSLEDELLRFHGDGAKVDLSREKKVASFVRDCQTRVEEADYGARLNTTRFDGVMNKHRQLFYGFREALVDGLNVEEAVCQWAGDALLRATRQHLDGSVQLDERSYRAGDVKIALGQASQRVGIPLELKPEGAKVGSAQLRELIDSAVRILFQGLGRELGLASAELEKFHRDAMLDAMDLAWTDHIEELEALKRTASLQTEEGQEPIQTYARLGFHAFEETVATFKEQAVRKIYSTMKEALALRKI